ncbi:hypothetical protein [Dasania marina]|uniref:hypothetical protein n=1 Tax=Dasania marina TaxID=471499 RepID=UPI000368BDDD|nr:hypothetical protein [Dasania marina]
MPKNLQITILTPVMTKEKFQEVSGLREGQIKTQIAEGNLETVKIGRLRLLNIAKITAACLDETV